MWRSSIQPLWTIAKTAKLKRLTLKVQVKTSTIWLSLDGQMFLIEMKMHAENDVSEFNRCFWQKAVKFWKFDLDLRIKEIHDLAKNWNTNFLLQLTSLSLRRFYVRPFVTADFSLKTANGRAYERTDLQTASRHCTIKIIVFIYIFIYIYIYIYIYI